MLFVVLLTLSIVIVAWVFLYPVFLDGEHRTVEKHLRKHRELDPHRYNKPRLPGGDPPAPEPVPLADRGRVSVLLPTRNGGPNLLRCVTHVLAQDYPDFELVVLNDQSTDNSLDLLAELAANLPPLQAERLHVMTPPPDTQWRGKRGALAWGVQQVSGDWVVTTDDDCWMDPGWLRTLLCSVPADALAVGGVVRISETRGWLERSQALHFAGLQLLAYAGFVKQDPYLCNGANWAYRRQAVLDLLEASPWPATASGDDQWILLKLSEQHAEQLHYVLHPHARVHTLAQPGWRAWLSQQIRWASKFRHYRQRWLQGVFIAGWLYNLCTVLGVLALPWNFKLVAIPLILLFIRSLIERAFLLRSISLTGQLALKSVYFPAVFMQLVSIPIIGLGALFTRKLNWRGRQVRV